VRRILSGTVKSAAALLLILLPFSAGASAENRIATDHFVVEFESGGRYYADVAARSAERSFERISAMLDHRPEHPLTLVLTRRAERFRELTGDALPDWSAAVALPGGRIVISPLEGKKIGLEHILAHEIVHCIIHDAAGKTFVPRWFHEGCAEVLSGRWGIRSRLYLVWHVIRGNLLSFDDIQRIFSRGSLDAGLAYDQSMVAVNRLIAEFGEDTPARILDGLERGDAFHEAFLAATGLLPSEFEPRYLAHMARTYGKRSLVTLIPGTWTGIILLAFFVYIVKKHRNRRLLREWEDDERYGNIIDFHRFPPDDD